jgi:hypothetical protein
MAQAARNTGRTKDGGTERCSLCNSRLELIDGTDPEKAQHGFVEEWRDSETAQASVRGSGRRLSIAIFGLGVVLKTETDTMLMVCRYVCNLWS